MANTFPYWLLLLFHPLGGGRSVSFDLFVCEGLEEAVAVCENGWLRTVGVGAIADDGKDEFMVWEDEEQGCCGGEFSGVVGDRTQSCVRVEIPAQVVGGAGFFLFLFLR